MIDRYLKAENWDEAHEAMDFEAPYGAIIEELAQLVAELRESDANLSCPAAGQGLYERRAGTARAILVRAPALINVALNYKICAEHGLPFHPTVYYELAEARRYRLSHPISLIEDANRLFRQSIALARAAYRLDTSFETQAVAFRARLPGELEHFIYTGCRDKYTWRASEPAKVHTLARMAREGFAPQLIVAAAHGSIMPGLLLAEALEVELYFVRFSMFKRNDECPILSLSDEAWLAERRTKRALLFDEDVAKGTTLNLFSNRLAPLFESSRTACVIRHAGAGIRPDFSARTWWD